MNHSTAKTGTLFQYEHSNHLGQKALENPIYVLCHGKEVPENRYKRIVHPLTIIVHLPIYTKKKKN